MKNWNKKILTLGLFLSAISFIYAETISPTTKASLTNTDVCPRYINGDSLQTTPTYSIYREFFKKELYSEAYPFWKKMYDIAPGFRKQTFIDGTTMYTRFIQDTEADAVLRQNYVDTLFMIYNKQIQCHGEDEYVLGRKAIDLLKYGKNSDIAEAGNCLEKTLKLTGDNAFPYYIQTYFKILTYQVENNAVPSEFVINKYDELSDIIDKNIAKPGNKQLQAYKDVKVVIDDLYTQNFADKNDPTDCAKLLEIYLKKYNENPNDLETIKKVYTKTKGCADSATNIELLIKLNTMAPNYSYAVRLGSIYFKNNQIEEAYKTYENAALAETDSTKKSDLYFILASIKGSKNDYPASRDLAKMAIQYNPISGKSYLLIGNLYLGSGKMCGPGTGFQSQIVLWPAFDYLNKAIEVGIDEVKEEAQKLISTYTQYLPTKADIAAKKLKAGNPYTVKCWINEETTVQPR